MQDPRFIVQKRQGAIIREADRQDLWQKWGSIMLNVTIVSSSDQTENI